MKTKNLNKTALLLISLLSIITVVFGNTNTKEIEKTVRAKKETYHVIETETYILYYNVNDPIKGIKNDEWKGEYPQPYMDKAEYEELTKELKKKLKAYITSDYKKWEREYIFFDLYCDIKGNIKFVAFSLPIELRTVPITLIEDIETFIYTLKLKVKVTNANRHYKVMTTGTPIWIKDIAN